MNLSFARLLPLAAALALLLAMVAPARGHGNPEIAVTPNPAGAGSTVTIEGMDFEGNEQISLTLEGVTGETVLGTVLTDDKGDFHFETDLPASAGAGSFRVRAQSSDATAFADLGVTAAASALQAPAGHEKSIGFHRGGPASEVIALSAVLAVLAALGFGLLLWREPPAA